MLVIVIKPQKCLHWQLFSLLVCRHTRQELWGDVKRDDSRWLWMSSAGAVMQVQPNNACLSSCQGKAPCLPGHLEQGHPEELGRHGKSRQMRSQKTKHEEDDPVQHHFEGFLQNSPVKDGGKGHYEVSGWDKTAHQQERTSLWGWGRQQGSQGGRASCLVALSAGHVGRPQSPTSCGDCGQEHQHCWAPASGSPP